MYDRVKDLAGKSYRLVQNNLDKDIVPGESRVLVKKDKVIVKLQKVRARVLIVFLVQGTGD